MMARTEVLLVLAIATFASVTAVRLRAVSPAGARLVQPEAQHQFLTTPRRMPDDSLDALADVAVDGDPFRIARTPSTVAYARTPTGAPPVPTVRPTFVLRGIIGPPWMAIIDGIPGAPPGAVVQSGATFDKLVIKRVTRDSVMIQGADTTWRLGLGRPGTGAGGGGGSE